MKGTVHNERGMALALAILALVVVGALVAGALFAGTQEQRVGEASRRLEQSFSVAELGLNSVVATWNPQSNNLRGVYPTDSIATSGTAPASAGSYQGYVYRLNDELDLIDLTGHDTTSGKASYGGSARQRVGLITRQRIMEMGTKAAVTTGANDTVRGNVTINGLDQPPPSWTGCGALDTARAGIRMDSSATLTTGGHSYSLVGNPPVVNDPSVKDTNFTVFGGLTYSQVAAQANITLPAQNFSNGIGPTTVSGQCDKTNLENWGDGVNPTGPCGGYFPIIHITGSGTTTINGNEGQGILLVDGNLAVQGGFQFFGIVIVQGSMTTSGGGSTPAHFWGTVMVRDSAGTPNSFAGQAIINYSLCAMLKVLNATAVAAPVRSRGWSQLF